MKKLFLSLFIGFTLCYLTYKLFGEDRDDHDKKKSEIFHRSGHKKMKRASQKRGTIETEDKKQVIHKDKNILLKTNVSSEQLSKINTKEDSRVNLTIEDRAEEVYADLFSEKWSCCKVNREFFHDDFHFDSGRLLIKTLDRKLVAGNERAISSFTSFILTLSRKGESIFPISIENRLGEHRTNAGEIIITHEQQKRLREPIKSMSIKFPVINQTAFYFKGRLSNRYPEKVSSIAENPDPSDVVSLCKEFKIVPAFGKKNIKQGANWKEMIGILYCKIDQQRHEKISLVSLRKI